MIKTVRHVALTVALLTLVACGSGDSDDSATPSGPESSAATTASTASTATSAASSSSAPRTGSPGVTLADVQALLPAGSGVSQNTTPDPGRCNFTWNEGGPRGIDVARILGGRAAFEQQSGKVPTGATALKDGTPYETVSGLGERAWAFGNARQANVVVVRGADLYAVDLVVDGTPPAGSRTPTGMDTKSLEICQALARKALG